MEAHFSTQPNATEEAIGKHCAALIERTVRRCQMGIGAIPNAVLAQLGNPQNLGIHPTRNVYTTAYSRSWRAAS